jgi:hypothetical protein
VHNGILMIEIILSVIMPSHFAECHDELWHYGECRGFIPFDQNVSLVTNPIVVEIDDGEHRPLVS